MATTTATAFDEFKQRLLLTNNQWSTVRARRDATASYARQAFPSTSSMPVLNTKMIGSAGRETIIRPIDDVDLLVQFENKANIFETYRKDSQTFLYRVRDGLKAYSSVQVVGARGQAVRFFYKDAPHVDVAPVFKWSGGGYALPDGKGGWLTTDPDFHADYMTKRNGELDSRLKPMVRMLKQWNRAHSSYFKSFHLEVIAAQVFTSIGGDSRAAAEKFFNSAQTSINVVDPAGHSGDLSSYMTAVRRSNSVAALETARDRAGRANAAERLGDHKEAIRLWGIVFGGEFPAYG